MQTRYLVVAGAAATQFVIIGTLFSFGLLISEFERDLGWSRTLFSASSSIAFFMMGGLALVVGPLADRFGPGRVLLVAGLMYGLGWVLLSRVGAPWQLIAIFSTLIGTGLAAHDVVTLGTVARWFSARRGLMTALAKVGTALGQMTLPPIVAALILAVGWRPAMVILGLAAAVALSAAASVMRHPRADEAVPDLPQQGAAGNGVSFAQARHQRSFWTLCAVQALFFPALVTVPFHLAVHGTDLGLSGPKAALLLSEIGAASIVGRLLVGQLLDRIGVRNAFILCLMGLTVGLSGLSLAGTPTMLAIVVAVYAVAHGGLFVVVSPTVAAYFGLRSHGAIFAAIVFCGTTFAAAGPVLAGAAFDYWGGYFYAFLGLTVAAALALALLLTLPRPDQLVQRAA